MTLQQRQGRVWELGTRDDQRKMDLYRPVQRELDAYRKVATVGNSAISKEEESKSWLLPSFHPPGSSVSSTGLLESSGGRQTRSGKHILLGSGPSLFCGSGMCMPKIRGVNQVSESLARSRVQWSPLST